MTAARRTAYGMFALSAVAVVVVTVLAVGGYEDSPGSRRGEGTVFSSGDRARYLAECQASGQDRDFCECTLSQLEERVASDGVESLDPDAPLPLAGELAAACLGLLDPRFGD